VNSPAFITPDHKLRARDLWLKLFNPHDLRLCDAFFAPDYINHNAGPGTPLGPEGARRVFGRLWRGCSDMSFELARIIAEADTIVCIGVMHGTHDGPFHGVPPTGKPTAIRHLHVLTVDDAGLVTDHLAVRDDLKLFR
jgi:predicted ester cyclase